MNYQRLADEVAARIIDGTLRPGEQLPTQRIFARRRGIAPSTAIRVYQELVRRGLVVGEVGRGSFVRAGTGPGTHALAEPADARIDLELNYPVIPGQAELLARSLGSLLRPEALADALRPIGAVGTDVARTRFAQFVARGEWQPRPDDLLFSGNGRQAITAALSALVPAGGRLGVEALTYPVVKGLAQRLGITLVPLPMDDAGIIPSALADAHRSTPLRAVYLQPRAHNPLGISWPANRRAELADVLRACDLPVIEDAVWSFLAEPEPEPDRESERGSESESALGPLAAQLPERTVLIDSLSKRLAPGLSVGFVVVASDELRSSVANALRSMAAAPGAFALESAVRWLGDGTVTEIVEGKRADAAERQRLVRELLAGQTLRSDQSSYYVWWELPEPWRAETFVASAHAKGIAVTSGEAFAADPRSTPRAVRIALASPPLDVLGRALTTLREIAAGNVDRGADRTDWADWTD